MRFCCSVLAFLLLQSTNLLGIKNHIDSPHPLRKKSLYRGDPRCGAIVGFKCQRNRMAVVYEGDGLYWEKIVERAENNTPSTSNYNIKRPIDQCFYGYNFNQYVIPHYFFI